MSEMFFIMVKKYMPSRMSVTEWTVPNQLVFHALIKLNKRTYLNKYNKAEKPVL